jgi:hypothetical protein
MYMYSVFTCSIRITMLLHVYLVVDVCQPLVGIEDEHENEEAEERCGPPRNGPSQQVQQFHLEALIANHHIWK